MTPAQHKTAAENALAAAEPQNAVYWMGTTVVGWELIHAHALLAQAAGTGDHYAAAEAAIAAAEAHTVEAGKAKAAQVAVAHALLADRP